MKKFLFVFFVVLFVASVCWQNESIVVNKESESKEEKKKEPEKKEAKKKLPDIKPEDIDAPKTPEYNERAFARAVYWTLDNLDKPGVGERGEWSLTGWSKMGLNSNFDPWYFKVGIISGRLAAEREYDYVQNSSWKHFEDWERREYTGEHGIMVGVHWIVFFGGSGEEKKDNRTEVERLEDSAEFYARLPHIKGKRAAVFLYDRILEEFPESDQAKKARDQIDSLKKRFPELTKGD